MSADEKLEYIGKIRYRRDIVKPAAIKHKKKAAKPVISKARKLFKGLTASEQEMLMQQLEE